MPSRKIDLAPLAADDLRAIWQYSVETWPFATADAYYNEIADRLDDLVAGNLIGFPVLHYPGVLKSTVGSHVVFFRLSPSYLYVLRILHQNMDSQGKLT